MPNLVLIRHGQSQWNLENRFTGWVDVDLSGEGIEEAHQAGRLLAGAGLTPDLAFTSVLKRAIRTLWIVLSEMDRMWVPQTHAWQLNERHYGALQGLNKAETAERHGKDQVQIWRRSFDVPPPPLPDDDPGHPRFDPRYQGIDPGRLPRGESLKDTLARVLPYWASDIAPRLRAGRHVICSAHGNSLRALFKHLLSISDDDIPGLEIPTGKPALFQLDENLNVLDHRYLV
ncbi:MAG: 2,3-diphosphoglycerate-dependent phosphoglycerate mutase [Proteobacteria bacterium]|nr:2,3-diphosphoglycerate-dependent phosphoglycerate mutase [Pseudomonadota bacterium]